MRGNIYFVRCRKFVKIGYAQDVSKRVGELQIGNPYPLQLLAVIPGTPALERYFHIALTDFRERGEWFRWSGSPVRKLVVLINNGARPETLEDVRLLRDYKPRHGLGRGISEETPTGWSPAIED